MSCLIAVRYLVTGKGYGLRLFSFKRQKYVLKQHVC